MTRLRPHARCRYIRFSIPLSVLNRILYTQSSLKYGSDKHILHLQLWPTWPSSTSGLGIPTSILGIHSCNSSWPPESLVSFHLLGSLAAVGSTHVIATSCSICTPPWLLLPSPSLVVVLFVVVRRPLQPPPSAADCHPPGGTPHHHPFATSSINATCPWENKNKHWQGFSKGGVNSVF